MGEVNAEQKSDGQSKGTVIKGKKLSTRVDMKTIVALAFLLLTFFMLATTFIKPQVMELILPEKQDRETESKQPKVNEKKALSIVLPFKSLIFIGRLFFKVNEKKVLSIVLCGDNKIYWYIGMTNPQVQETDYSETGIRKVLVEQNMLIDKLVVLIKPDETSTYENLVDILDKLKIADIAWYALVDMENEDRTIMARYLGGDGDELGNG